MFYRTSNSTYLRLISSVYPKYSLPSVLGLVVSGNNRWPICMWWPFLYFPQPLILWWEILSSDIDSESMFSARAEAFPVFFSFVPSMKIAFNSLSTQIPPSQNPFSPFVFYTMCWWLIFQELEFSTSLRCGALHREVFYIRVMLPGKGWRGGGYFLFIKGEKEIEPRRKHC